MPDSPGGIRAASWVLSGLSAWLDSACVGRRRASRLSMGAQPASSSASRQTKTNGSGRMRIQPLPGEMGAGVGLAARRDVAVAHDCLDRVGRFERGQQRDQGRVLGRGKRQVVAAFQFDADGKVVAAFASLPGRLARMLGAQCAGYELDQRAVAADVEVRRHLEAAYALVVRMRIPVEPVGEEVDHGVAVKYAGRQRNIVDDDALDRRTFRSRIAIQRKQATYAGQPTDSIELAGI